MDIKRRHARRSPRHVRHPARPVTEVGRHAAEYTPSWTPPRNTAACFPPPYQQHYSREQVEHGRTSPAR